MSTPTQTPNIQLNSEEHAEGRRDFAARFGRVFAYRRFCTFFCL